MSWTNERKLEWYCRLPWRVIVEIEEDGSLFARVDELPGAVAHGANEKELEREFWESVGQTIRAYIAAGDQVPMPVRAAREPWTNDVLTGSPVEEAASEKATATAATGELVAA